MKNTQDTQYVLELSHFSKKYSKKSKWAVEDLSFTVSPGEIVGLVGHNGAGKSTTLKCITGMLGYSDGEIKICGIINKQGTKAKQNMGFVTDNHAVFLQLTGKEYLSFMADIYGVSRDDRNTRLQELEKVFGLGAAINNLISTYSHGMRQKICMMGSLISQPKLWILDEPMTGLDPKTISKVEKFMLEYKSKNNSILFSSHSLETVERICDRVIIISGGKLVENINLKQKQKDPKFSLQNYVVTDDDE